MTENRRESNTPKTLPVGIGRLRGTPPVERWPGRNLTKADILVYRAGEIAVVVKDYRDRPFLVRNSIGRVAVRREAAAYRAAEGLPGIPEYYGRPDPFSIALRFVPAKPLVEHARGTLAEAVFDRLDEVVRGLHARGIAVGDLHHRDVLVGEDGSVHVVDLATSVVLGRRPGIIRRAIFERLRDQDRIALARLRARFTGRDEDAAVRAVGGDAARRYARWRRLRRAWDFLRGRTSRGAGRT